MPTAFFLSPLFKTFESMKKTVFTILAALALLMPGTAAAQDLFNHLAVNAHVATTGVGVELSTPITKFITMRAGVTCMPGFSFNAEVYGQYYDNNTPRDFTVNLDANLKRTQGSVIFNVYPLAKAKVCSSFFLAAGLYFGGDKLVKIKGHSDEIAEKINQFNGNPYIELGDYKLPVDENGNVKGGLKVQKVRPYLGLGFGRYVPNKRISVTGELGVQFHGHIKPYTSEGEIEAFDELTEKDDWKKVMDKLTVYPMLKIVISGRIF